MFTYQQLQRFGRFLQITITFQVYTLNLYSYQNYFVIIFHKPFQMQSTHQGPAIRGNNSFTFNYLLPQHVTTVLFSPKNNPPKIQFTSKIAPSLSVPSMQLQHCSSAVKYSQSQLDTTIDSLNEVPMMDFGQVRSKKPLCQSVIVTETNSKLLFNDMTPANNLTVRDHKERQFNPMKRSCMPGTILQNSYASKLRSANQGKENCQFLKYNNNQSTNKVFCFSKNKLTFKKSAQKLSNAKIQDFQVGIMLGRGSVGRVYLARHCATNCYFALKKIAKSEVKDIKQFCYGIKCHMFLSSPHIVQLYACFSDQQSIYLLMQLCPDGNLAKHNKGIKHENERNKIVLGTAKGIQAMHRHNMRHGDLKLQNVLVSFGLAKITDLDCVFTGTQSDFIVTRKQSQLWGSPAYFSPDMIKHSTFSLSDDVWALGVITYEIFTKFHPFSLIGSQDLTKIVDKEMAPLPQSLRDPIRSIITSMLSKDANKRIKLQQIIQHCQATSDKINHK